MHLYLVIIKAYALGGIFLSKGFAFSNPTISLPRRLHVQQRVAMKAAASMSQLDEVKAKNIAARVIPALRGGAALISPLPGLGAALVSPASSALGFMIWDNNWHGSAFALNLVKNVIASGFFAAALVTTGALPSLASGPATSALKPLALSAFLGVVLGDCTAIASLKMLGARRFLLIDCLKPAVASAIGATCLGDKITPRLAAGILAVVAGVFMASTAKAETDPESSRLTSGFILAAAHIVLDTAGASITKVCGAPPRFLLYLTFSR